MAKRKAMPAVPAQTGILLHDAGRSAFGTSRNSETVGLKSAAERSSPSSASGAAPVRGSPRPACAPGPPAQRGAPPRYARGDSSQGCGALRIDHVHTGDSVKRPQAAFTGEEPCAETGRGQARARVDRYGCGSRVSSVTAWSGVRITRVSRFRGSTCPRSSRHRPHGAKICPISLTATMVRICDSRAFSISATAACSAQKPRLQAVSTQTPVNRCPEAVSSAAATLPAQQSSLGANRPVSC